jgi:hypothetical protein
MYRDGVTEETFLVSSYLEPERVELSLFSCFRFKPSLFHASLHEVETVTLLLTNEEGDDDESQTTEQR